MHVALLFECKMPKDSFALTTLKEILTSYVDICRSHAINGVLPFPASELKVRTFS